MKSSGLQCEVKIYGFIYNTITNLNKKRSQLFTNLIGNEKGVAMYSLQELVT